MKRLLPGDLVRVVRRRTFDGVPAHEVALVLADNTSSVTVDVLVSTTEGPRVTCVGRRRVEPLVREGESIDEVTWAGGKK